ncbi:very short patch repair endonuclease (plasmid) [Rhizobium leguminosarum]
MDILSREQRSEVMSRIRGRNTKPEMLVRRTAHALGYRFRLHRKDLPGSPDLVFPGRRIALFVHGCFWHRHKGCRLAYVPKSNEKFWQGKFERNIERDSQAVDKLQELGWKPRVIWECQTRKAELAADLQKLLENMP